MAKGRFSSTWANASSRFLPIHVLFLDSMTSSTSVASLGAEVQECRWGCAHGSHTDRRSKSLPSVLRPDGPSPKLALQMAACRAASSATDGNVLHFFRCRSWWGPPASLRAAPSPLLAPAVLCPWAADRKTTIKSRKLLSGQVFIML